MRFRVVLIGSKKIITEYLECEDSSKARTKGKEIAEERELKGLKYIRVVEVDENNRGVNRKKTGRPRARE